MAVTAFDGNFSMKQAQELAHLAGKDHKKMSKLDWELFANSPFMNSMRKAESLCGERTSVRDKARADSDPEFIPSGSDWTAAKSFDYDKTIDYYKVLGLHEYASLAEVKKAYRKLSLVYHPDKTAGMSEREKDEHGAIFLEIKNAYKLLSDQATRRQYDRDRDRDLAKFEVNGQKPTVTLAFDATKVLKKMQEAQRGPAETVAVPLQCRLEKFIWGGNKVLMRGRRFRDFAEYIDETKTFRIDIPAGAPESHAVFFEGAGDHQDDRRPDNLEFVVTSKPHADVERQDDDLNVRRRVHMSADTYAQPYISGQTGSVRGRHLVFWGRNPFYHATGSGAGLLRFRVQGEGVTSQGSLNFEAKLGIDDVPSGGDVAQDEMVVIHMKHLITKAEMAVRLPCGASIADAKAKACEILCVDKVKVMRAVAGGYEQYQDDQPLGTLRSLDLGGASWTEVPLPAPRALQLLRAIAGICETDVFQSSLSSAHRLCQSSRSESEAAVLEIWAGVAKMLPDFGFPASVEVLRRTMTAALQVLAEDPQTAFLRERCRRLVVGFDPDHERSSAKSSMSLLGLGTHPLMVKRCQERQRLEPTCEVQLAPMFGAEHSVVLFTKPTCTLRFYSNLQQASGLGQLLRPRPMFAVSISCEVGAKKKGLAEWISMRKKIAPLIQETFFYMIRAARGILPRPLANAAAFRDEQYTIDPDALTFSHSDLLDEGCSESDGSEDKSAEHSEDDCRVVTGGGGGFFDFDDLEESQEVYKKKQQDKEERRRAQVARRIARRTARLQLRFEQQREAQKRKRAEEQQFSQSKAAASSLSASSAESTEVRQLPVPWARLGEDAFRRREYFLAACHYGERIRELRKAGLNDDALALILSKRSACYAKVGHFDASLADAKAASEIKVDGGDAWSRIGFAASSLGPEFSLEAQDAYANAVQHKPTEENVAALCSMTRRVTGADAEKAHKAKEEGNEALLNGQPGLAVARYTIAVAQVPRGTDEKHKVLLAAICANRSLAFAKLGDWEAAVRDAREAIAASSLFVKARHRLGTALLGCGLHGQAYCEFVMGLQMDPKDQKLRAGRDACLAVLPLWQSTDARARFRACFSRDMTRPKGSTRIFAISDVHFDHKRNMDWARNIDDVMFREDVLIVAGNVADTLKALVAGLRQLRTKFRRVFYTVGNHDLWIHPSEASEQPDSLAKLMAILRCCDELGVDVGPAAVCEGTFVVPLFSWYNSEFDEKDPFPEPTPSFDTHCKWPIDANTQVWKFFLALNAERLRLPYHGTVISFSHFLPRQGLPFDKTVPKNAKAMGCEEIDDQVRSIKSKLHVFGHSRKRYSKVEAGVVYVNHPLGFENEHSDCEPIMCVFNGNAVVQRPMQINDWLGRHV